MGFRAGMFRQLDLIDILLAKSLLAVVSPRVKRLYLRMEGK
jgi:hypothetical protein